MMISRKGGLSYVNRAEQSAYDYNQSTLTKDGAWHTLNLSAIVPANAKLVLLRVGAAYTAAGYYFRISKAGQPGPFSWADIATQAANIVNEQTVLVDCSGQQIQYWCSAVSFSSLRLLVLGWFL